MEAWKPAIEAELKAMFQTKSALTVIDPDEAKKLLRNEEAECLPSKMVYTLKPSDDHPQGKRKARLVVCGNFSEEHTDQSDLFAAGATAVALRTSLALASQHGWCGKTSDIRTAFLSTRGRSRRSRRELSSGHLHYLWRWALSSLTNGGKP